jgi:transposase
MSQAKFVLRDRETSMLLPPNLQDWLPDGHLARFIVEAVEQLDLRRVENSYEGRGGSLAYAPKMLTALLLYGYATGIFSSRKLERACHDSIAFRYITANTSPDHDTIAAFRLRILPYLPDIFLHVLRIAKELGMLKVGTISVDGTKIKANASKHHALSHSYTSKLTAKLRREITRLLKIAEQAEKSEQERALDIPAEITRREDLIKSIAVARKKIEEMEAKRLAELKAKYEERMEQRRAREEETGRKARGREPQLPELVVNGKAQVNLTDEESRIMPTADGFVQGYNAQAGVTTDGQFIVSGDVVQDTNDKQQVVPMLESLRALPEDLGKVENLLGDAGYYSKANAEACERAEIVPYLAMGRQEHHAWLDANLADETPPPGPDAGVVPRMAHRLRTKEGREIYGKRKSSVEPTFGITKSVMGFRAFFLRGLEKVRGEWKLVCTAYNLRHLHALIET